MEHFLCERTEWEILDKKDNNWGLFPPNGQTAFAWVCHSPHPSSALFFFLLLLFDEEQLTLESVKSLTEDELCAGWPELLQDNPIASIQGGDLSRFKGEHSHKCHEKTVYKAVRARVQYVYTHTHYFLLFSGFMNALWGICSFCSLFHFISVY